MSDILKDSRFAKYLNDPRYRQIPKHERKVKIDKRFQSMFSDEKFKVKYTVDKRGRPVNETSTENLRKYYDLDESDESTDEEPATNNDAETKEQETTSIPEEDNDIEAGRFVKRLPSEDEGKEEEKALTNFKNDKLIRGSLDIKTKRRLLDLDIDYARGEGVLLTDSSSEEEDSESEEESDLEHEWGELDADAETTDESTRRIAVCNMDWDNIKATDLMVLLSSFLPPGGVIHHITVYPSEYGLKRMQEEDIRGPIELTEDKTDECDLSDNGGNEEGSTYHMEKLRRYQLNRLKYFYAVVECDTVATADKLYSECDGMEYESSATKLDMRFIPDDVTFDQEPRETCTKLPDLTKYKPRLFTTTALQQAKVDLTWDATNPKRAELIKGALDGKIDDLDLKEYLASSSDDSAEEEPKSDIEDENEDPIQKYKMLLDDIETKEQKKQNKDMEMEITWGLGVKDKAEELVKKKINEDDKDLTPFEKLLQKRKEKKKQRKLNNKQKTDDTKSDSDGSSSDEIPSDVDMSDPYFAEEFNKPDFKNKKLKAKRQSLKEDEDSADKERRKAELELLIDKDEAKEHFSLKKIQEAENINKKSKRKRKLKEKIKEQKEAVPDFEINLDDRRFAALYDSHLFNIDPTDPNFKKTKNMEKLIHEKLKRRPKDDPVPEVKTKKSKEDAELNVLVKNIKRKTKDVLKK
ncbi:ESF1 homolog [Maniola jurtina]|uniref:ESF1 homolog n=1 Tax=Maniola jurtina TaxID=191418 RepID=UPI001E68EEAA|nr:ESF1 homolog [Maniola jurtina]XP_045773041.1 ESF1 homolog [Maniola jurtina]